MFGWRWPRHLYPLRFRTVTSSRLQGLKDQLAAADGDEAEELRDEIEELEDRIKELTEFKSGASFHKRSGGEP